MKRWDYDPSTIAVVTKDGTVPITEASWVMVHPCGCVSGVTIADHYDAPVTTAQQAGMQFCEYKPVYDRLVTQGYTWEAHSRRAGIARMSSEPCSHEPKWGVSADPELDGYVWARRSGWREKAYLLHLAPAAHVSEDYYQMPPGGTAKPLCGSGRASFWSSEAHGLTITCKTCTARALKAVRS